MDLEELARENEALNEQVKLLVKTERRLYGAQRTIEMQLRRLEALTGLATSAARAGDPDRILELALHALLDVLDADQAVALVATPASGSRLAAAAAQPGCEAGDAPWSAAALELPLVEEATLLMPRTAEASERVGPLLDAVHDYFMTSGRGGPRPPPPAIELVVPLRRKSRQQLGLIVVRKLEATFSLHENRISTADLPFVALVGTRVEVDVENVLLYRDLETFASALEQKVEQRTRDLAHANEQLTQSLRRVRDTQAKLVEATKSAALLTLIAGLSHELNNPIGVILGYAQALLSSAPEGASRRQLSAIERQARRCGVLVKALLGFAENRTAALDLIPPATLLRVVAGRVERDATERGVRVSVEPPAATLPPLHISAESMHEALGELVKNALDATPAGGAVVLHARRRRRNGAAGVELSVRDSGGGIPRAFRSRIFDPFFTTKPPGKGVGLGLSLARRTVEMHGGKIDVRSELGRGTTVRVWLPVASAEPRRAQTAARATAEDAR